MKLDHIEQIKELQPGTVLNAGKYIIEKKIGEGGFGITYKAMQKGLNRTVCIKEYFLAGSCVRNTQARTVHLQGISDEKYEKYRQAFVKEAQTVASLHHPNIVEVIDIFDENNTSYMVMSFIEGRSLQEIVDSGGPLSYPDAVNYMAQITNAVGYIHEHNILHRDIKPENIMITANYKAILIDFGSAREFEQDKTQNHTSMLTHGYAPPEQYTANSKKGSYTDIYALGATLYFILTGQVPLEAAARLTEELVEPKQLNPSIPAEGNRTIMKAMKLKKEERYQVVQDFMDDLRNTGQKAPLGRRDIKVTKRNEVRGKNSKRLFGIIAILVLLLGSVFAIYVVQNQRKVLMAEQQQVHEMDSIYVTTLNNFENCLCRLNDTMNLIDDAPMMGALEALQTIDNIENTPLFNKSGKTTCYLEKKKLYKQKVDTEKQLVLLKLTDLRLLGVEGSRYYHDLLLKEMKCDSVLYVIR
jgi:serine/threonine protein kinase